MATRNEEVCEKLNDLIQLDFDAIEALPQVAGACRASGAFASCELDPLIGAGSRSRCSTAPRTRGCHAVIGSSSETRSAA